VSRFAIRLPLPLLLLCLAGTAAAETGLAVAASGAPANGEDLATPAVQTAIETWDTRHRRESGWAEGFRAERVAPLTTTDCDLPDAPKPDASRRPPDPIGAIRSLPDAKLAGGPPAAVCGVVTFYDPASGLLYLEDITGGIELRGVPAIDGLAPGRELRVDGQADDTRPIPGIVVNPSSLEIGASAALPDGQPLATASSTDAASLRKHASSK
jgi:hypothetical protein